MAITKAFQIYMSPDLLRKTEEMIINSGQEVSDFVAPMFALLKGNLSEPAQAFAKRAIDEVGPLGAVSMGVYFGMVMQMLGSVEVALEDIQSILPVDVKVKKDTVN